MDRINPLELYSLKTVNNFSNIVGADDRMINKFWNPNPLLLDKLCEYLDIKGIANNILDVGCGSTPFPKATHLVDFDENAIKNKEIFKIDLDFEKFPHVDDYFNFIYCRHTLEDIQNPTHAFNELVRIGKSGYIETPSPLIEIMKGTGNDNYRGYCHHRYIVWSELETNTLNFLPKYPLIEGIKFDENIIRKFNFLANNYSVYWNNYYKWDSENQSKVVIYRNGINFNIIKDYVNLINKAIYSSFFYTNKFIESLSFN